MKLKIIFPIKLSSGQRKVYVSWSANYDLFLYETRIKKLGKRRSSQLQTQFLAVAKRKPEKFRLVQNSNLCDTGAALFQLS